MTADDIIEKILLLVSVRGKSHQEKTLAIQEDIADISVL